MTRDELIDRTDTFGHYATFQAERSGERDPLLTMLLKAREWNIRGFQPLQFIFPFVRTAYNITKRTLECVCSRLSFRQLLSHTCIHRFRSSFTNPTLGQDFSFFYKDLFFFLEARDFPISGAIHVYC